jgi:hypothetical protein
VSTFSAVGKVAVIVAPLPLESGEIADFDFLR